MRAIKFVTEAPDQEETNGYQVNLRNDHWLKLGLVDDSRTPAPKPTTGVDVEAKPKPKA
jgi:hypothetical protein